VLMELSALEQRYRAVLAVVQDAGRSPRSQCLAVSEHPTLRRPPAGAPGARLG
jgi:hypothetical protein